MYQSDGGANLVIHTNSHNILSGKKPTDLDLHFIYKQDISGFSRTWINHNVSGPSCSKLTMSLVNDSLKFTSSDMQIC